MNWKGCGRKRSWPSLRYYPSIFLQELRKTTKILSQDSWSLGRDLNPGLPEYEAGVLTTQPKRSINLDLKTSYYDNVVRDFPQSFSAYSGVAL
jgi:hypothetical protein